jgi:hypothetical protein
VTARNLATVGYSPPTELIVLKNYGIPCAPKTVIWQIAESNDLEEAALFQHWVRDGRPDYLKKLTARVVRPAGEGWQQHSPTFRLFRVLRSPPIWPLGGTFHDNAGRDYEVRFLQWPSRDQSPVDHAGWPVIAESIEEGAKLSRERQIRLIVMLVPMKMRVLADAIRMSDAMRQEIRPNWDIPQAKTMAAYLGALCKKLDVPFLDLTPILKEHALRGELVYQPLDTHLSPAGHRIVADALEAMLAPAKPPKGNGQ